jgi:hypothetical protein
MGTLTASNLRFESAGSEKKVIGTFAFGSSYNNTGNNNTTGETISAYALGLQAIRRLKIQPEAGYDFQVLYSPSGTESDEPVTSVRVKVFQSAGGTFTGSPLAVHGHNLQTTVDEIISVNAGTGVSVALTNRPVGTILGVYQTAGGVTGASSPIPQAASLATLQYKFDLASGVLTFLIADAVTSATVTYTRAATSTISGGTPAGTVSAGAETEVPNATNLSTALAKVQFEAYGF